MYLGEKTFNSTAGSFVVTYKILSMNGTEHPTILFIPDKAKYFTRGVEITAVWLANDWRLKAEAWEVDKEEVKKYCREKLKGYMK